MERHVYCKHIKNKTLRGYMVRGVPFLCLYDAESQCTRIEVEPDKSILLYEPAQARQAAGSVVSVFSFGRDAGKSARRTVQSRR